MQYSQSAHSPRRVNNHVTENCNRRGKYAQVGALYIRRKERGGQEPTGGGRWSRGKPMRQEERSHESEPGQQNLWSQVQQAGHINQNTITRRQVDQLSQTNVTQSEAEDNEQRLSSSRVFNDPERSNNCQQSTSCARATNPADEQIYSKPK